MWTTKRVSGQRFALVVVLVGGVGAAPACGGNTTSGSGHGSVSSSELPRAIAQAICTNVGPCCQQNNLPLNVANCEASLERQFASAFNLGDGGPANYNAAASGPCLDAVAHAASTCNFSSANNTGIEACAEAVGNIGPHGKAGDPCDETCTRTGSSTSCYATVSSGNPPPPASPPTQCYTNDGIFCDFTAGTCKAQSELGAPCNDHGSCNKGWCQNGVCAALLPPGGACSSSGDACQDGNFCDFSTGVCTPLRPDGQPCTLSSDCINRRCRNQVCDSSTSPQTLQLYCIG